MRCALLLSALLVAPAAADPPVFTHAPVDLDRVTRIVPLGNLNPPGHTFPTDHAYFYLDDPAASLPVYAPAAGVVAWIHRQPGPDDKVVVRIDDRRRYYLGHVTLDPGMAPEVPVQAGQRLGTFSGKAYALDLGVIDDGTTLAGFVRPERYPPDTIHAVAPFPLFVEPLKSRIYGLIRRPELDRDGKIDFDRPGRLSGNWFLEGVPVKRSCDMESWAKHLAFVYDVEDPESVRIAIGGTLEVTGLFAVAGNAPDPVEVVEGRVRYDLQRARDGSSAGVLLVELLAPDRIRVQAWPAPALANPEFDGGARVYER